MNPRTAAALILLIPACVFAGMQQDSGAEVITGHTHEEENGFVMVEAEHFNLMESPGPRRWYVVCDGASLPEPDGDPPHLAGASGGAYVEVLPDTRRTHDDELVHGENFSNQPGQIAILHYRIQFNTPGRYYVWVSAFSTGTEDNGVHVGLNGTWPESGQRMQWCEGKNSWRWESKQRTQENQCGEERKIYLDIDEPGVHTVQFSMREDGFEFDRFILTQEYELPASITEPFFAKKPATERVSWRVDGLEREALVFLPQEPQGAPVVFGFHGHGGRADSAARKFAFQDLWPEALVVYMQGVPTVGKLTDPKGEKSGWQNAPGDYGDRDLAFFDAVLETMLEEHGADPNRVYASGHSNGGGFTYLLWITRPGVFAAIAPSASAARALRGATPEPVPVMHIAGRNDTLVKFEWQQAMARQVCRVNGCGGTSRTWGDHCKSWAANVATPLVTCVHNEGHQYPVFAPKAIVEFFRQHVRR